MTNKCNWQACQNEGTILRDWTCGPLCDYRYFCAEHIKDADEYEHYVILSRTVEYLKSKVRNIGLELAEAEYELIQKFDELKEYERKTGR